MTVLDLKQILSNYPDDMEVFVDMITDDQYEDDNVWTSLVREPIVNNNLKRVMDMKIAARPCQQTKDAKKCLIL